MKSILTLAVLAAAFGAPAAAETITSPTIVVHYADLDLANPGDVRQLGHRIANAVSDVCGEPSSADLAGQVNAVRCRKETLKAANAQRDALSAANRQASTAGR